MYILLFIIVTFLSGFSVYWGIKKNRKIPIAAGVALFLFMLIFIWFMGFWGRKLWFDSLGFIDRFWIEFTAKIITALVFALIGALYMLLFSLSIRKINKWVKFILIGGAALLTMGTSAGLWPDALRFFYQVPAHIKEPILNLDISFYLFTLPLLRRIYGSLLSLSLITLIIGLFSTVDTGSALLRGKNKNEVDGDSPTDPRPLFIASALFLFFLSLGRLLARYTLLFADGGIVSGPGWTDVFIRLPALLIAAALGLLGIIFLFIPKIRNLLARPFRKLPGTFLQGERASVAGVFGFVIFSWIIILALIPWLMQALFVTPNEITYEKPYIEHNIEFTKKGFKLDSITEEEYAFKDGPIARTTLEENQTVINNIRLWDWRALDSVYEQFQEIRLYYEFGDIDIDRYNIDGEKRTVMISAREMETSNLPQANQNFVNEVFKYTHGYGIALNTVNEFTSSGLPHLLIKDIPPVNEFDSLKVDRPEIYYGERTNSYVVVNSTEEEFDYPEGDNNQYVHYAGNGGVEISNLFRKFIFGYRFGGTKLFLSGYPDKTSRILFNRNIIKRVRMAAPFLHFDHDPYIVLINGELRWIIDAYTTSTSYPYSEHFSLKEKSSAIPSGINYIRNSVKAVVDPYNGDIDLYIYDDGDPIVKVWNRIYPGLLKQRSEMPEEVTEHVRYPADFLLLQGEVYAKYHMNDPEVFYNQEDLWVRATEKYYNEIQPVEPYYIIWERPGSDEPEFILMLPYTPKSKQVLIGWIAGMSDPENYGEFIAYKFPKERRILGPQQMETKIDQDSFLSGQLTLWNQRGSNVIRGNILVLPLNGTLLYVEPIYLQSETAAYPELRMVAVMHNDKLSYAPSLEEALEGLFTGVEPQVATQAPSGQIQELAGRASEAFRRYTTASGRGDFEQAGKALEELKEIISDLSVDSP